jgi:hypothetical protein
VHASSCLADTDEHATDLLESMNTQRSSSYKHLTRRKNREKKRIFIIKKSVLECQPSLVDKMPDIIMEGIFQGDFPYEESHLDMAADDMKPPPTTWDNWDADMQATHLDHSEFNVPASPSCAETCSHSAMAMSNTGDSVLQADAVLDHAFLQEDVNEFDGLFTTELESLGQIAETVSECLARSGAIRTAMKGGGSSSSTKTKGAGGTMDKHTQAKTSDKPVSAATTDKPASAATTDKPAELTPATASTDQGTSDKPAHPPAAKKQRLNRRGLPMRGAAMMVAARVASIVSWENANEDSSQVRDAAKIIDNEITREATRKRARQPPAAQPTFVASVECDPIVIDDSECDDGADGDSEMEQYSEPDEDDLDGDFIVQEDEECGGACSSSDDEDEEEEEDDDEEEGEDDDEDEDDGEEDDEGPEEGSDELVEEEEEKEDDNDGVGGSETEEPDGAVPVESQADEPSGQASGQSD